MDHRVRGDLAGFAVRARQGDRAAFRSWLEATSGTVFRVALRMLGDVQAAEDVTQETFVRAWQRFASLKDSGASLGWVCRIARNVATDRLRRPSRRESFLMDAPLARGGLLDRLPHPGTGPEDEALSQEECVRVRAAMTALAPKQRTVLLLKEVEGMSYEEIATAMGIPRGTVESRIHRARARLKKALERSERREARGEA